MFDKSFREGTFIYVKRPKGTEPLDEGDSFLGCKEYKDCVIGWVLVSNLRRDDKVLSIIDETQKCKWVSVRLHSSPTRCRKAVHLSGSGWVGTNLAMLDLYVGSNTRVAFNIFGRFDILSASTLSDVRFRTDISELYIPDKVKKECISLSLFPYSGKEVAIQDSDFFTLSLGSNALAVLVSNVPNLIGSVFL